MEGAGSILIVAAAIGVWVLIVAYPYIVARRRRIRNLDGVKLLCVLSLFIPVVWIVAICYAALSESQPPAPAQRQPAKPPKGWVPSKSLNYDETKI